MIDRHGQCLGNYRLMSLLGCGGFAEVYLGEHIYLKTHAAVKILQAHLVKAEEQEDFLREAQTIARLAHPHIVRIFDFGVDGQTPYLAMEYAPGGTLRQSHPRGERLELSVVVAYVRQIAEALHYIHNERLIHRDVKPENMLVGKSNEILLGDFGIALVTQSSRYQSTQNVVGTVAYMAPEQIQGQPRPASDQYALAIVVYEWLCGRRPFNGSFTELCTQHMFAPVPSLRAKVSSIAPEVEEVVMTALAKDPKERFASIAAFATALEQAAKITWNSSPPQAVSLSSDIQAPGAPTAQVLNSSPNQPLVAAAHEVTPSPQVMTARHASTTPSVRVRSAVSRISRRTLLTAGGIGLGAVALGGALFGVISRASHSDSSFPTPTPSLPRNPIFLYQGHATTSVTSLSGTEIPRLRWSPDGTRIMSTDGRTVQVWDAFDGKHASTYHLLNSDSSVGRDFDIAWTTNGPCLAQMDLHTQLIHVLNAIIGQDIAVYSGHASASEALDWSRTIAWSPDSTRIVSMGYHEGGYYPETTRVWNAMNGQDISSFTPSSIPLQLSPNIDSIVWSPDSARIALPCDNGVIYVWDPSNGKQTIAFSKHTVDLYTLNQSTKITHIDLSWSPNSQQIVSVASYGGDVPMVRVWDVNSGNQIFAKGNQLRHISWSPQAPLIAVDVPDSNSTVQIWNASNGQVVSTQHYNHFAWSPDGKRIASDWDPSTPAGGALLNVWDATSGARLVSYSDPSDVSLDIASLTWSPDGKYIATGSNYGTIAIWRV